MSQERVIWLVARETGRKRKYEVDVELEDDVLQRLNDAAYGVGFEVVSTCAGHTREEVDEHAHVAFHLVYDRADDDTHRVAELAGARLRSDLERPDTRVDVSGEPDWGDWSRSPRRRALGRVFVRASRIEPTNDAASARAWFREIVQRVEPSAAAVRQLVTARKI